MSNAPIALKRERSPTPPLTLAPRRSGVKLVAPLPAACRRSSSVYQQARKAFIKDEVNVLNGLGLTVTRVLVRDDGLSLEWESPVPVWPDTLKPVNEPSSSSVVLVEDDTEMRDERQLLQITQEEDLEKQATELEDMAVEFLKKYAQVFDTDRASLAGAYATNALFSYCIHEYRSVPRNSVAAAFTNPSAGVIRFAPRKGSRNLLQAKTPGNLYSGPSEIATALQSFGPHKFCARSPTDLQWNVLALHVGEGPETKPLVFLSSHGDLTEERASGSKRLSFNQCFLLQRPGGSFVDQNSEAVWPLVAVNHQLTVRDLTLRPPVS